MPELPEVETIVRYLKPKIIGLKITDVWVDPVKPVKTGHGADWPKIKKEIIGRKILSLGRRAKYIVMDIEGSKTIFIHQKISGHLLYGKWGKESGDWKSIIPGPLKDDRQNQYIRLILFLSNRFQLALSDLRRFAKIILVDADKIEQLKEMRELGPEPLGIKFDEFFGLFKSKRGRLKQVLMDPRFIAGIGNIYGDEVLWDAGYHPLTRVENLELADFKKIYSSMKKILLKAIKYKGDSMDDYRLPSGEKGRYQLIQKAYQKTDSKCLKKDGGKITRIKVNQRSAHFCSAHQRLL